MLEPFTTVKHQLFVTTFRFPVFSLETSSLPRNECVRNLMRDKAISRDMLDVRNFQINTVSKQKGGESKDDWDVG